MYLHRDPVTLIDWFPTIIVVCLIVLLCGVSSWTSKSKSENNSRWRTNLGIPILVFLITALVIFVYILLNKYKDAGFFIFLLLAFLGLMLFALIDAMFISSIDDMKEFDKKMNNKNDYIKKRILNMKNAEEFCLINSMGNVLSIS